jgi:hypothetical protein
MVTTAKSAISRPAPNQSSASATRLASLSMATGRPSRSDAARASPKLRTFRTEDQKTWPLALSTKPGTPMPTAAIADRGTPAAAVTRSRSVSEAARSISGSLATGWRGIASLARRFPAKSSTTAVCSRSESFMPTTRCAWRRTPSATGGRPRPASVALPRNDDLLQEPEFDQFGRDRRDRGRAYPEFLGHLDARHETRRADALEDLLAERAERFGQRRDQGTAAAAAVVRTGAVPRFSASIFFSAQRNHSGDSSQRSAETDLLLPSVARILIGSSIGSNYFFDNRIYRGDAAGGLANLPVRPAEGPCFGRTTYEEKNASRRGAGRDQPHVRRLGAGRHHRRRQLVELPGRALEDRRGRDPRRARRRRGPYVSADAQSSSAKQLSDIESLIAQGVDALIILAQDASAIGPAVQAAADEGIPVVAYDRLIEDPRAFYLTFDNVEVGRMQARAVLEEAPEGNYVMIKGSAQDPNADFLRGGQQEVLQEAIDAGRITIVGEAYTDGWLPANAQRNMEQILTANDNNVDAVVASNDGTAGGAIAALRRRAWRASRSRARTATTPL